MTGYYINIILNHSILLPAAAGIIRSRSTLKPYYPFLLFIWLAAINETLSLVLIYTIGSNTINSNIYILLEYIILLFQFYEWSDGNNKKLSFFITTGILVWIIDNLVLHSITDNNSIYRSYYSIVILLYSIDRFNNIIMTEKKSVLKNAAFLACVAFMFYYGCKSFVEIINIFHLPFSHMFYRHLWQILSAVNCICNFIYIFVILWSPKKQEFLLLS